jgi:hypothetical protein
MDVQEGDTIYARITAASGVFSLYLLDETAGLSFSTVAFAETQRSTVEWVAEASSTNCVAFDACDLSELPDFGYVRFFDCRAEVGGVDDGIYGAASVAPLVMAKQARP